MALRLNDYVHSWTKVYRFFSVRCKTQSKNEGLWFLELGMKPDYLYLNMWKRLPLGPPAVTVQSPKTMNNLSNFLCLPRTKCENVKFRQFLIGNKAVIFVCGDVKYHRSSCTGNGTMMINIEQSFKFAVISSAPKDNFGTRTEGPPRHCRILSDSNTVLVHYGTIISWSCHNEPSLYCFRAEIGKIFPIVSITALSVSGALRELGFLSRIGLNEFERLLIVFGH